MYNIKLRCAMCRFLVDCGQVVVRVDPELCVECPRCKALQPCSEVHIDRTDEVRRSMQRAKKAQVQPVL